MICICAQCVSEKKVKKERKIKERERESEGMKVDERSAIENHFSLLKKKASGLEGMKRKGKALKVPRHTVANSEKNANIGTFACVTQT